MQTSMHRTIPFSLPWDDAPLDLSFVFAGEKPAGCHGFLQARNDRLVFEDATVARFWGTNFNSAANFPSHAYSEIVARRLAKFGLNLVRFHQMDADWSTPNIFQFTKGRRPKDSQSLDPVSLERLDYLIYCLKREGIYVYLDLLTYRTFRSGDGVAASELLGDAAKPYANFDRRLIELQKKFNEQLWTHVNPHTGLAYKDDPAIVLSEITNENELFHSGFRARLIEPYRTQLEARFVEWCRGQGLASPVLPVDFSRDTPPLIAFLGEVQKDYYRELIAHLRKLGVRVPITGTNWCLGGVPLLEAQLVTDFTDSHTYWYGWSWRGAEKRFANGSLLGEREAWFASLSSFRVLHKPFFVSEWDDPWPNEWRAESSLLMAAVAGFQGWSGAAIHTYRYDCRENVDQLGAPITSDAIGGVPYRGGVFDTFNDPAKFGLFYHAALIVRRGDVREPTTALEIEVPLLIEDQRSAGSGDIKALAGLSEMAKVGLRLPGQAAHAPRQIAMTATPLDPQAVEIRSETGELYRNLAKRYATIDTPRTKAAYGFLGGAGKIELRGLTVHARTDFATLALSSLTDADTAQSDNLLLTAVGRADNTGAAYNSSHTIQFKLGHGPIQAEVIEASLELTTASGTKKIWAISPTGFLIGQVPAVYEGGKLKFTIGGEFASIYYLIQRA